MRAQVAEAGELLLYGDQAGSDTIVASGARKLVDSSGFPADVDGTNFVQPQGERALQMFDSG